MNTIVQLLQIATIATQDNFIERYPLVCFSSETYPLLFLSRFLEKIKKETNYFIKTIDETILDEPSSKAQLAVSFLGQRFIFWCSDISQWPARQKKEFINYLASYHGPHSIWLFTDDSEFIKQNKSCAFIILTSKIAEAEIDQYLQLLGDHNKLVPLLMHQIFKRKKLIPLDELVLTATYAQVMSKPLMPEFINTWVYVIISQDQSLFDLSNYFSLIVNVRVTI